MQPKIKLVEVARSFSRKLNLGNYETADFFCSQKAETTPEEAEAVSEKLFKFCEDEVMKSLADYGLRSTPKPEPPKVTRQDYAIAEKEAPAQEAEANVACDILAEEKYKGEEELPTLKDMIEETAERISHGLDRENEGGLPILNI